MNEVFLEKQVGAHYEKGAYIHSGGSADFALPKEFTDFENAIVLVKDGKTLLKKKKHKDRRK